MIGGFHVDDSAYCGCAVVVGGSAGLAVQQIMGILPQRRTRLGGRGPTCTACGRTALRSEDLDPFSDRMRLWFGEWWEHSLPPF